MIPVFSQVNVKSAVSAADSPKERTVFSQVRPKERKGSRVSKPPARARARAGGHLRSLLPLAETTPPCHLEPLSTCGNTSRQREHARLLPLALPLTRLLSLRPNLFHHAKPLHAVMEVAG